MKSLSRASTGIPALDEIIDGLRIGDNVVWQVDEIEDYRMVARAFVERALAEGKKTSYFRFARHASLLEPREGLTIHSLDAVSGFETFSTRIHTIITEEGEGAFYVFDCLSDLLQVWATDLMVGNFFMITCPYLFELKTVAYFAIESASHAFKTVARIRETTQVLLDAYNTQDSFYIQPLKVWKRYSPTMFLPHRQQADCFTPVTNSIDATRLSTHMSRRWEVGARRNLDYWDRLFLKAAELTQSPEDSPERARMVEELCRIMMVREPRMSELSKRHFRLEDLLDVRSRMIGTGYVGGKTVGMLLARALLTREASPEALAHLEPHDSFYVGSDVFYTYLVQNGWWKMRMEQKTPEGYFEVATYLREQMLSGGFPDEIQEQFIQMLEYFGQSPIIVRSSSLLEDSFGSAFAGKYESIFLANQGTPGRRYDQFENAVRRIFASTMNEDALIYRRQRGLEQHDEQMALLVQRVSGSNRRQYFFPELAGVGVSRNTFVWKKGMDPASGMLRLVYGLGTRAVDRVEGDYPRIVALDEPLVRPHAGLDDLRTYSQHQVDVINIEENHLQTLDFHALANASLGIDLERVAVRDEESTARMRQLGRPAEEVWLLSFDTLLRGTDFAPTMQRTMKILEREYAYPVDVEFTVNFDQQGEYRINLVQCRPLQTIGQQGHVGFPERVNEDDILLRMEGNFMGGSISQPILRLICIDPQGYTGLALADKYLLARVVGELNRLIEDRQTEPTLLMGPGRWGTTTPSLGVPVHFSEINNMCVLLEVSDLGGTLLPELSYGTHFFQDLVETEIFFIAVFPWKAEVFFRPERLEVFPNLLGALLPEHRDLEGVLKVYDLKDAPLRVEADMVSQRLVCFLDRSGFRP